ncbi:MAG: M23 family metallopeptidase, partial [bacterium]|nr:M23 family metallopeptidase [bacterium]
MAETPKGGHVFDLAIGESVDVEIDGRTRRLTLVEVHEPRCAVRGVIRFPRIVVEIDGERVEVPAALYHLPQELHGVKIACSVTRGVAETVRRYQDVYALDKDARIRCWAPGDPLFDRTPLVYPARQAWFVTMTQMANERVYVDGGELPAIQSDQYVYHHYGMDIGGYEKAVPVVAARGGTVVCVGETPVAEYDEKSGGKPRYDRVVVRDETGWHYLYSHIEMISPEIRLGERIEAGAFVGTLGKEGSS